MPQASTLSMGMAGHKASLAVAEVAQERHAEVRDLGALGTRQGAMDQLSRHRPSQSPPLGFVYEAGPCGAWLYRYLPKPGHACGVVAPSLSPTKAGERGKTHRRAALQLARLRRSGDLPPLAVPQVADEASRALRRAREEALHALKTARHRLHAFRLRHDSRYTGQATWGPAHLRWRRAVVWPTPTPHIVFHESVRAVTDHSARLGRRAQARPDGAPPWRLRPVVAAR